ncbi:type IV pilin protein [Chromobacterium phragmitis]|uniref:type IV pilin protein n=1 Tax=Chromobacterium phragmitis TaxID=2202141 RepID=UPI000DECCF39|nr:type IV pilin protein [Chromobacterium phragmitis]AXE29385.1 type IV pilin protein [Chromobacterium phragmitis]
MRRRGGFTLTELVVCMAILAVLLALAVPGYSQHLQRARLAEARAALLENGHYMQRWYQLRGGYHQEGTLSWPQLPVLETGAFVIGFSSLAPSSENLDQASFIIEARPKTGSGLEEWLLKLDQDGNIRQCRQESGVENCRM